jgi:hypothetical protein
MATPSTLAAATITPTVKGVAVGTSSTQLLSATTAHAYKVKWLSFANKDSVARTVTCNLHSAVSGGGTAFALCYQLSIPANSTLVLVGGGAVLNMGDAMSIYALAGTAATIEAILSYDDIS